ncbi:MAG: hypothetical protein HRU11_13020 [Parvularculaceae bacterium]|nr:hypothetical protein [Parvularculaceae bacterium]
MADLLAQAFEVFATPLGRGVLAISVLAVIALVFYAFWDVVRMPRQDNVSDEAFDVAPPPVMSPKMVTRKGDVGFVEDRTPWFRNGVMAAFALVFALVVTTTMHSAQKAERREAMVAAQAAEVSPIEAYVDALATQDLQQTLAQEVSLNPDDNAVMHRYDQGASYCSPTGSLQDRSVEVCEAGAAIRLDLLRLSAANTYVVKPAWDETAPTFVRSESHAAPFGFASEVGFAAPETVGDADYDGYLVVGVANAGDDMKALQRAEALRGFAIRQLSGGDRAQCLSEERVYTTTAVFDADSVEALADQRDALADLARRARGGTSADRAALEQARADLAQAELLYAERPAPIVIGIKADPVSSDPDADMREAAAGFLEAYGPALQLMDVGPVNAIRACARGEVVR